VLLLKLIFFPTFSIQPPLNLYNLSTYLQDRLDRDGGGATILVRRNVQHSVISLLVLYNIESVGVSLHLTSWGPLSVIGAYKCPSIPLNTSNVVALSITGFSVIVRENLNCKHPAWNSCVDKPEG
jgi:hypothetical protein